MIIVFTRVIGFACATNGFLPTIFTWYGVLATKTVRDHVGTVGADVAIAARVAAVIGNEPVCTDGVTVAGGAAALTEPAGTTTGATVSAPNSAAARALRRSQSTGQPPRRLRRRGSTLPVPARRGNDG